MRSLLMTNHKRDEGKLRYNQLPALALEELAKVFHFGAEKYGDRTYLEVDNLHDRYLSAAMRHLQAYRMGERLDRESRLHHTAHAAACLMIILEADLLEGRANKEELFNLASRVPSE